MVRKTILRSLAPAAVALLSASGAFAQDTMQPGGTQQQQQNQPVYQQPGQPGQYQPPPAPRQQPAQPSTQRPQGVQQQQRQQGTPQGAKQTGAAAQDASIQALVQLHAINQLESEMALGGINQAESPSVQRFAQMLAKEHQESDVELMQTARKLDIDVAPSSESEQMKKQLMQDTQSMRDQLKEAQGAQFDRAFLRAMVQTHQSGLQQVGALSTAVQDPQVSKMLQSRIKIMQKHLERAQELEKELSGPQQGQRRMQGQQGTQPQTTTPGQQQNMPAQPR